MAPGPTPPRCSLTAWLVALALVVCVLEGAGRKWLLPDAGPAVQGAFYFAKDVCLLLAVLTALHHRIRTQELRLFRTALVLAAGLLAVAVMISVDGTSLVGGCVSLRNVLVLPCFAVLLAPGLRSPADVRLILRTVGALAVLGAAIGVLQFYLPPSHFLNQQVSTDLLAVEDVGHIRASGTFAYITGMQDLAMVAAWAGLFLVLRRPRQAGSYVALAASVVCSLTAMSRAGLLAAGVMLGFTFLTRPGQSRTVAILLGLAVAAAFVWMKLPTEADDSNVASAILVRQRADTVSTADRIYGTLMGLPLACNEFPLGNGIGSAQNAQLLLSTGAAEIVFHEYDLARVVFEVGIVGLAGVVLCRLAALYVLWRSFWRRAGPPSPWLDLRRAAFAAAGIWFVGNTTYDHVAATFAWVIVAVAFATLEMDWWARLRAGRARAAAAPVVAAVRPEMSVP